MIEFKKMKKINPKKISDILNLNFYVRNKIINTLK